MGREDVTEVLRWMHLAMGTDGSSALSDDETPVTLNSVLVRLRQIKAESDLSKNEADRYKRELDEMATNSKRSEDDLKKQLQEKMAEIDRFKNDLGDLTAQSKCAMDDLKSKLEEKMAEVDGYKKELEGVTAQSKNKLADLNAKLEAEKSRCTTDWESRLNSLNESLCEETAKVSQLTKELEDCRRELDRCKAERDALTAASTDMITLKDAKIRQMEVELDKIRAELTDNLNLSVDTGDITSGVIALQLKALHALGQQTAQLCQMMEKVEKNTSDLCENQQETSEMTIRAKFKEISKLTEEGSHSRMTKFAGIFWRIQLWKNDDYLAFQLVGENSNDAKCTCSTFLEFRLISQQTEEIVHCECGLVVSVFDENNLVWGYEKFIAFKDLFDAEKGYVMEDSIIVAVVVKAFPS